MRASQQHPNTALLRPEKQSSGTLSDHNMLSPLLLLLLLPLQAVIQVPAEPAEGAEGVLTVAFRLPSGSRLSRRFNKADSVAVAAAYVAQQMAASGELAAGKRVVLSTQFPKKVLQDVEQQLDAAGIEDRSILTVAVRATAM